LGVSKHNVPVHESVTTLSYKLIHYYEPEQAYWELFDLQQDPDELRNAYDDPDYAAVRSQMHRQLIELKAQYNVPAELTQVGPPQ